MIAKLQRAGLELSKTLLHPDYEDTDQDEWPLNGLCFPLSEALWSLFPGCFTPCRIGWDDGGSHWFLRDSAGAVVDLVSYPAGCCDQEDYDAAQHRPFWNRQPSKRTRTLLQRAGLTLPTTDRR